jgi:NAD-binding of NADP-dependent 3-hydroxyisobutyrate dehydrogenase
MTEGRYDFGFAVNWMRKDLGLALDEATRNGAALPVTALVNQFYREVQTMGVGGGIRRRCWLGWSGRGRPLVFRITRLALMPNGQNQDGILGGKQRHLVMYQYRPRETRSRGCRRSDRIFLDHGWVSSLVTGTTQGGLGLERGVMLPGDDAFRVDRFASMSHRIIQPGFR